MKLGVCLIVKNEERDLPVCLCSVRDIADLIHIVDTGSTDSTEQVAKCFGSKVSFETYTDASELIDGDWKLKDFSQARNHAIAYLDDKVDWILWMDADDELLDPFQTRGFLMEAQEDIVGFHVINGSGNLKFTHHRAFRTKKGFHFKGKCHEYLSWGQEATVTHSGLEILHHWSDNPNQEPGISRNLRILGAEYEGGVRDNRTLFYYGNALREAGRYEEAEQIYWEYLQNPISYWDEMMFARLYQIRCLCKRGLYKEAIQKSFEALALDQRFSEIWMELSYLYYVLKDFKKAAAMAQCARQDPPDTMLFLELDKYTTEPVRIILHSSSSSQSTSTSVSFS